MEGGTAKKILAVLSVIVLILAAFYLGQRTQIPPAKKQPAKKPAQAAKLAKKQPAAVVPVAVRKPRGAKVAIVIDDFGYSMTNLPAFFDIKQPLTFSILPNLRHSRDVADSAKAHGYEAILHLPLASHRKDAAVEKGTLKPGADKKEIDATLAKAIASVPGITGVSNHQGSLATEDIGLMSEICAYLKKQNLYFFDSLTSEKSVCRQAASGTGIKFAQRDMFLDNSNDVDRIHGEINELERLALKRGRAIAICHDRKNTAIALAKFMPQMAEDGIEFVYLSEMEK